MAIVSLYEVWQYDIVYDSNPQGQARSQGGSQRPATTQRIGAKGLQEVLPAWWLGLDTLSPFSEKKKNAKQFPKAKGKLLKGHYFLEV